MTTLSCSPLESWPLVAHAVPFLCLPDAVVHDVLNSSDATVTQNPDGRSTQADEILVFVLQWAVFRVLVGEQRGLTCPDTVDDASSSSSGHKRMRDTPSGALADSVSDVETTAVPAKDDVLDAWDDLASVILDAAVFADFSKEADYSSVLTWAHKLLRQRCGDDSRPWAQHRGSDRQVDVLPTWMSTPARRAMLRHLMLPLLDNLQWGTVSAHIFGAICSTIGLLPPQDYAAEVARHWSTANIDGGSGTELASVTQRPPLWWTGGLQTMRSDTRAAIAFEVQDASIARLQGLRSKELGDLLTVDCACACTPSPVDAVSPHVVNHLPRAPTDARPVWSYPSMLKWQVVFHAWAGSISESIERCPPVDHAIMKKSVEVGVCTVKRVTNRGLGYSYPFVPVNRWGILFGQAPSQLVVPSGGDAQYQATPIDFIDTDVQPDDKSNSLVVDLAFDPIRSCLHAKTGDLMVPIFTNLPRDKHVVPYVRLTPGSNQRWRIRMTHFAVTSADMAPPAGDSVFPPSEAAPGAGAIEADAAAASAASQDESTGLHQQVRRAIDSSRNSHPLLLDSIDFYDAALDT